MADPQTGGKLYCRSSPTGVRVLNTTSGSLASGSVLGRRSPHIIWLWRLVGLEYRRSIGLGERGSTLIGWTQGFICTGNQDKSSDFIRAWTRPTCLAWSVSWGDGGEGGYGSLWGWGQWWQRYCGISLHNMEWVLLDTAILAPRPGPMEHLEGITVGTAQTKQPTGQEHSYLKFSGAQATSRHVYAHQRDKAYFYSPMGRHQILLLLGSLSQTPDSPHPPGGRPQK